MEFLQDGESVWVVVLMIGNLHVGVMDITPCRSVFWKIKLYVLSGAQFFMFYA